MGLTQGFADAVSVPGTGQKVAILGGGASGVLMALHLLRHSPRAQVVLIEKSDLLGCGVAYGTRDPAHLLNTRVANMSAFADDPDHFLTWLRASVDPAAGPYAFVSRATYGRYLAETLADTPDRERLTCLCAEAVKLTPGAGGVQVRLADGRALTADAASLATGHALPANEPEGPVTLPWGEVRQPERSAGVLIVGTGLTMVDHARASE